VLTGRNGSAKYIARKYVIHLGRMENVALILTLLAIAVVVVMIQCVVHNNEIITML
jgi:hypothetical protein